MEQIKIQELIKNIAPLYNLYKDKNKEINGTDALILMWEIGSSIEKTINELNIPPHNLYRKIYGKAEGKDNISQKSYITREFLGRAYRIKKIFKNKDEIKKILPGLQKFISFREAMPFFDNQKYILTGKERENLLSILNSNHSPDSIMKKIKSLQHEKIDIKNPRNQRLEELSSEKDIFINFYNHVFNLIKNNNIDIKKEINNIENNTISKISLNTGALIQEGLSFVDIPNDHFNDVWLSYVNLLKHFNSQVDAKERRRFRRLIPSERIAKLAEMLGIIISKNS